MSLIQSRSDGVLSQHGLYGRHGVRLPIGSLAQETLIQVALALAVVSSS